MDEYMKFLGMNARDVITGAKGIVTSISFDLYGCVQGLLNPGLDKDGKPGELFWYDLKRLETTSNTPVMKVPTFESVPGGQKLPQPTSMPMK